MTDLSDTYDEDYYFGLPAESGRIAAITQLLNVASILLHIPLVGRLFASRLFVIARKK